MFAALRPHARGFALVVALVAWCALGLQLFLTEALTTEAGGTLWRGLVIYLGFFTILTNILVAVTASCLAAKAPRAASMSVGPVRRFFTQPTTLTAVAVYIAFVGLAYHTLLRHVWNPHGLSLLANVLLHYVVPALYVTYWAVFASKAGLRWTGIVGWCLYPIAYLIYALVRGEILGNYPYHFIDVSLLGYPTALRNSAVLTAVFVLLSLVFITLGRYVFRRSEPA